MKIIKRLYKLVALFPKRYAILSILCLASFITLGAFMSLDQEPPSKDQVIKKIAASLFIKEPFKNIPLIEKVTVNVKRNDTLISILKRAGVNYDSIQKFIDSRNSELLTNIRIGDKIKIGFNESGDLQHLSYEQKPTEGIRAELEDQTYKIFPYTKSTEAFQVYKEVIIEESLYQDGLKAGLPDSVIMDMAYIYGWDIDFTYDLRPGDSFSLIYEEVILDGVKIKDGDILIAKFNLKGKEFIATRFDQSNGKSEYFSPEGRNIKKAFLRSPVNFSYVSSRYNLKRKHPILYKIKAHTGVDYAASKGTPVIATGDGTIVYAATKGGYGNLIEIKHSEDYLTRYAHLNKFHKRSGLGKKIEQGQVIGYVGKSGMATGYHLHYEFHVNGKHTNPLTVKFPNARPVNKNEFSEYSMNYKNRLTQLNNFEKLSLTFKSYE